ncbi:hypothetical protein [Klebsiella sp. 2680]|uniref:hypothetical protein n=1 Tax=Klebsiella sp. 2680 TaxID=2018037 RepID=UPI00115887A6|nr:hypothetical protein [Klebsiella sp. 2680]
MMEFRLRAHHATAANIVNPAKIRCDAVYGHTIEVFYPANEQLNGYLYYSIVFINLLKKEGGNISRNISSINRIFYRARIHFSGAINSDQLTIAIPTVICRP